MSSLSYSLKIDAFSKARRHSVCWQRKETCFIINGVNSAEDVTLYQADNKSFSDPEQCQEKNRCCWDVTEWCIGQVDEELPAGPWTLMCLYID